MSIKRKLEKAMYDYVDKTLLPVCYDVAYLMKETDSSWSYDDFLRRVHLELRGEEDE